LPQAVQKNRGSRSESRRSSGHSQDEARREKQKSSAYTFSWDKPIFESPFELRRLRVLNALFLVLARCGGKSEVRGHDARQITVTIHQTAIFLVSNAIRNCPLCVMKNCPHHRVYDLS
jgi:hypothetical protein